ncbi:plasmid mobilization relaxosome protein MobC [Cytophagaceae bacterium DM2B3-1]|uniref:Plasmid mobilization relaxosome protein MobC n=1 Tax=Xanthocytophaga flava TaxID=3048013 RepID=A0ABT7CV25_9BACT|nr:plasmid mobilization relaxosome protein MobC [Xanthocytophaga flavus]MDJ1497592.1 plasmid mobilization relaxosome protein MobC [Xanthocytophaga flavus]
MKTPVQKPTSAPTVDQSQDPVVKLKGNRGRKPKSKELKASQKVGGFWLTPSEKDKYDRLYTESGLGNQTEFFKQIVFGGKLELYYSDKNTNLIREHLFEYERQMNRIGTNYNQLLKRVNSNDSDKNLYTSVEELKKLTYELKEIFKSILTEFEKLDKSDSSKENPDYK